MALALPYLHDAVLDGEIVCLDRRGRPQFNDLLFKRGQPCFFAFDALYADGKDFRRDALIERKIALRQVIQVYGEPASREIFAEHRLSDMKPQFIRSKRRSKRGRSRDEAVKSHNL